MDQVAKDHLSAEEEDSTLSHKSHTLIQGNTALVESGKDLNLVICKEKELKELDEAPKSAFDSDSSEDHVDSEDESDEDHEDGDDEQEQSYEGPVNEDGKPHGHGKMIWKNGNLFEGLFQHGERMGNGEFRFSDGSSLAGHWTSEGLEGVGVYTFPDGSKQEGVYSSGELQGPCVEWDSDGFIYFLGHCQDGVRCGPAEVRESDGGYLVGVYNENGAIDGEDTTYVYPGGRFALYGRWENGVMKSAKFCRVVSVSEEPLVCHSIPQPSSPKKRRPSESQPEYKIYSCLIRRVVCEVHPEFKEQIYSNDESTSTTIASQPLTPEPYESLLTYVDESNIQGADEGLFARVDFGPGELVSVYNGIRLKHKQVDSRGWEQNSNTITLDDKVPIKDIS
eukprot:TRINITY_DN8547_c0_g2_i1.p1 TRINITY_DN8547_c0_g2~~TRINITY_DN8547_c0_g2_i1.p1  ORF type:complete len:393 (+),score=84.35 TRINITY_DN8547_c0_g2_i1:68-1246(+)